MKEVSCRAMQLWIKPLARRGIPLEALVKGTHVTVAQLKNKNERLDWTDLCTMHGNLRPHFSDEELVEVGRSYFRSPALRFVFVIARVLLTPMGFYRWLNKPREGAGNQMFTCIVPKHIEISETECEIELTLPDGYEVCWDWFLTSLGNMEEMPTLLGYPPAKIDIARIPRGARYHIHIPNRVRFLTRLRRAVTWPFTVRAAARELQEAHETLLERYAELDTAKSALDRQRAVLATAYRMGQRIWGERDPGSITQAIAKALVELAGFSGASVEVSPAGRGELVERATAGVTVGDGAVTLDLSGRGDVAGGIAVMVADTNAPDSADDAHRLLDLVAPTIALALANAFHQKNLEVLVDQRTAELRQARDQMSGTVEQQREAQGARERFFGNISHEIRTPLSLILLAASDIKQRAGAALDDRAQAGLSSVADAARKLVRLVDEVLLLAAGQEDKLQLAPEPTDMVPLIGHLVSAWRPAAEAAGLDLRAEVPDRLVALVDPVAMERVASNLVSNAVKYTPRGGRVEIELADDREGLRLSVKDTGPGIDAELATRLFGRFERAKGEDRRKIGTGLGLSLVKQLVEAHGATVSVKPRSHGTGSELRVVLASSRILRDGAVAPARVAAPLPTDLPTTLTSGTRFSPPETILSRGTIVLAEDDARLAEAVAQLLSDEYTLIVALDGEAALELVRTYQPQLLITDVDMPGINGIELSARFREVTGDKLAPIIILSAVIDLGTRVAGLEAGAVDYVTKPFDPVELRARVHAQFRMRDLAIRLHRAEQLSMLGILTSGLAHELRNPANGIVNAIPPLTTLLPPELTRPGTGVAQLLEVMTECAEQIGFLSKQLLSFRTGGAQLDLRPTPVGDLVGRAVALAHRSLAGVEVRAGLTADPTVLCAPPLMVQVLTNLIENAAHAAGEGGWVEIDGHTDPDRGRITVEVADSGPGVPIELRDRVFEPFFTTKPPGSGSGLGLPLARAIVVRHGGVLEIRERGARPVFVVDLPVSLDLPVSKGDAVSNPV